MTEYGMSAQHMAASDALFEQVRGSLDALRSSAVTWLTATPTAMPCT